MPPPPVHSMPPLDQSTLQLPLALASPSATMHPQCVSHCWWGTVDNLQVDWRSPQFDVHRKDNHNSSSRGQGQALRGPPRGGRPAVQALRLGLLAASGGGRGHAARLCQLLGRLVGNAQLRHLLGCLGSGLRLCVWRGGARRSLALGGGWGPAGWRARRSPQRPSQRSPPACWVHGEDGGGHSVWGRGCALAQCSPGRLTLDQSPWHTHTALQVRTFSFSTFFFLRASLAACSQPPACREDGWVGRSAGRQASGKEGGRHRVQKPGEPPAGITSQRYHLLALCALILTGRYSLHVQECYRYDMQWKRLPQQSYAMQQRRLQPRPLAPAVQTPQSLDFGAAASCRAQGAAGMGQVSPLHAAKQAMPHPAAAAGM